MGSYHCPKCHGQAMVEMRTSDHVDLDFCESCNGLWFDRDELADYLGLSRDLVEYEHVKGASAATELDCPKCHAALHELPFSTKSDLLIDRCGSCGGTFFDFREVAQAQLVAADLESPKQRLSVIKKRFFEKGFGT
jgi:Zn-finger nucleic acid-binding protein